jgi:hypothetical protein
MKRVSTLGIIAAAAFFCAAPLSLQWSPAKSPSLALDTANARIGHPVTPTSVAGVHRRAMRRTHPLYGCSGPFCGMDRASHGHWVRP